MPPLKTRTGDADAQPGAVVLAPQRGSDAGGDVVDGTLGQRHEVRAGHQTAMRRSQDVVEAVQDVPHALALRPQVGDVLRIGRQLQRDALGDVEAESLQTRRTWPGCWS